MSDNVVQLYGSNMRDIPASLRELADKIEAGEYGSVDDAAFVMMGSKLEVFGMGPGGDGAAVALLLHAGAHRIVRAIEGHGRE